MVNLLSSLGLLGVLGALAWLAFTREPHWSSRDGCSFIARAQVLHTDVANRERWREVRGTIGPDGVVRLVPRGFGARHLEQPWRVEGRSPEVRRGRVVFVLIGEGRAALRLPARSRSTALLSQLLEK